MFSDARNGRLWWGVVLGLGAATLLVYARAGSFGFIRFDDPWYVTNNKDLKAGLSLESLRWAFTTGYFGNWHPLTWISLLADWELYGKSATGFHWTNIALHLGGTWLLFAALARMTHDYWPSAFAAALFALHPLHVESVVWVSERKGILSTFFWMATLWCYARYVESPSRKRYAALVTTFCLGLMAKQMLVTLPAILLLLDYWPLRRVAPDSRQIALEKIPLLVLAAVFSVIAYVAQFASGALPSFHRHPLDDRIKNAVISAAVYLGKFVWPANLTVFYPHPPAGHSIFLALASAMLLIVFTIAVVQVRRAVPFLFVGWWWYLIALAPVIGLVPIGRHSMADRYTDIPLVGIDIAIGWSAANLVRRFSLGWLPVAPAAAAVLLALGLASRRQVEVWRNDRSLFEHSLRVTQDNQVANQLLGSIYAEAGELERALQHFYAALRHPDADGPGLRLSIAEVLIKQGRAAEAVPDLLQLLEVQPGRPGIHQQLGKAYSDLGQIDLSLQNFRRAAELNPTDAVTQSNLGALLHQVGRSAEAAPHFARAVELDPDYLDAHFNLANLYSLAGRFPEARRHYQEVLRIEPDEADAHYLLAGVLAQMSNWNDARTHVEQALRLRPNDADFRKLKDELSKRQTIPAPE